MCLVVKANWGTILPWEMLWLKCMASVDRGVPMAAGSPVAPTRDMFGVFFLSQEQGHCGKGGRRIAGTQVSS